MLLALRSLGEHTLDEREYCNNAENRSSQARLRSSPEGAHIGRAICGLARFRRCDGCHHTRIP